MEPWNRQHGWFWLAAACFVGGMASLYNEQHPVVENSVEAMRFKIHGPVYRHRIDLPTPSVPREVVPPKLTAIPDTKPPLLAPQLRSFEVGLVEQGVVPAAFKEESELETQLALETKPVLPKSVWLSGQIELGDAP